MTRLDRLALVAVSVFAFVAIAATSAFAAKEFLANGAKIGASLSIEILEERTLHDLTNGMEILCIQITDATFNAGGTTGSITEVLMDEGVLLAETAPNLALVSSSGDDFECEAVSLCEKVAGEVLMVALGFPWDWELVAGTNEVLMLKNEYYLDCLVVGFLLENTCSGEATANLLSDPVTGDAAIAFEENFGPHLLCDNGDEFSWFVDSGTPDPILKDPDGSLITWN
jgi:hypothetical protein